MPGRQVGHAAAGKAAAAGGNKYPNEGEGSISGRSESSISRRTDGFKLIKEDEHWAKHLDHLFATGDWNLAENTADGKKTSDGPSVSPTPWHCRLQSWNWLELPTAPFLSHTMMAQNCECDVLQEGCGKHHSMPLL